MLTGLGAVGASQQQAASGLAIVSLTMGLGCIVLSVAHRMPVTIAWSTPGAALLAGAALPAAGWAGAVGAFVVAGLLYLLTAAVKPLGDWVARIPKAVASAMLAGVLLTLCVAPFRALEADPARHRAGARHLVGALAARSTLGGPRCAARCSRGDPRGRRAARRRLAAAGPDLDRA